MSALRREELPFAVYLFDLDNLKTVNETGGQEIGHRLICTFADMLRSSTRREDILCRYGGDEFLVVLKRVREVDKAVPKGEDLCEAYRNCFVNEDCNASCSVGMALCGLDEMPFASLIERADQALYRAKQGKKGNCCLWREA